MQTFESFSTSRTDKSRIVIEKLDGVVEPNVTTPNKSRDQTSSNSSTPVKAPATTTTSPQPALAATDTDSGTAKTPMLPPPELDGVNPGLTARLEKWVVIALWEHLLNAGEKLIFLLFGWC